jgi:hypothetical protein
VAPASLESPQADGVAPANLERDLSPVGLAMTSPAGLAMTSPAGVDGATGSKFPLMTTHPRAPLASLERAPAPPARVERALDPLLATMTTAPARRRSPLSTRPTSTTTTLRIPHLARAARDLTDLARVARDLTDLVDHPARAARDLTDLVDPVRVARAPTAAGVAGEPSAALTPRVRRDASSGAAEDGEDLPREARAVLASPASHLAAARAVHLESLERAVGLLARVERDLMEDGEALASPASLDLQNQVKDLHLRRRLSSTRPMSTTTMKRSLLAHPARAVRDPPDLARVARDLTDLVDHPARAVRDLVDHPARAVREDTAAGGKRFTLSSLLFRPSVSGPSLCLEHC